METELTGQSGEEIMKEIITVVITTDISSPVITGQIQLVDGGLTTKTSNKKVSFHSIFVSDKNHCTIMPP